MHPHQHPPPNSNFAFDVSKVLLMALDQVSEGKRRQLDKFSLFAISVRAAQFLLNFAFLHTEDTEVGNILRFLVYLKVLNVYILRCSEILSWESGKGRYFCFEQNWLFSCYFPRKVFVNK